MSNWQDKVGEIGTRVSGAVEQQKHRIAQSQEASAMQKQIQTLFDKKAMLYFNIGQQVYEFVRKGNVIPDEISIPGEELREIDVNIFNLQGKLNALEVANQSTLLCTNTECKEPIQADDRFCGACGQKQEKPKVGPQVQCIQCEQNIPEHAKFCNVCGTGQKAVKNYAL